VDALDKCSVRLAELQKDRYDNVGHARIQDTVPHIRCEEAHEVENIRQVASAAKLGEYARDESTPHRNDLPPREELPYLPPRPTFWQMMAGQLKERSNPKAQPASPLPVAQPPPAGNQTETPGNPR
jgi:hypothetical protein